MKKTRIIGALLAGVLAVTGVPELTQPLAVSVSAASKLAAPTNIKATVTDTSVKLTWSKVSGADAYRVFMLNSKSGKYEKVKNVSGTSANITGLTAGKTYKFKAAALVKSGSGYALQTTSAAAAAKTLLAAPKNFKASVSGSTVKLTWSKVTGADAYRIYLYDSSTKKFGTLKNVSGTSCTLKGVDKGTYQYKAAALVKAGGKYTAQALTSAVTAKVTSASSSSAAGKVTITFPSFGKSKDAAIKSMGLTDGIDVGEIKKDVYGYGGMLKVNGEDCMVLLYFNDKKEFFYGAVVLSSKAISFSKMLSSLKAKKGSDYLSVSSSGLTFYEWVDSKGKSAEFLAGADGQDFSLYGTLNINYIPDSMKSDTTSISDGLSQLSGLLS